MRIFVMFLLSCLYGNLAAYPKISAELAQEVSAQEISALISVSEKLFEKKVESVEYVYRDEPPVGDSAAIVLFMPEKKSETIYIFPSAIFYYLPWSKDNPLPPEKKKLVLGHWASDGKLQKQEKYRCALASGTYYVRFARDVGYEQALELLKAIESNDYDIDFEETGQPEWDKLLKSINTKEVGKLNVKSIHYLHTGDILETKTKVGEYRITANVADPKDGLSMWTFSKKGNRYILVAMLHYVI